MARFPCAAAAGRPPKVRPNNSIKPKPLRGLIQALGPCNQIVERLGFHHAPNIC